MKKALLLSTAAVLFLNIYAQNKNIRKNISKAKENNGVEYMNDSIIKKVINVAKIESFYTWAETADSSSIIDNTISWDATSLRTTLENYRNTTYDYTEILNKCRQVAESLRMKNSEMSVATVDER